MLPSQRALFDIPREICYLNAASWSPLPIATQDAGRAGVARKGQPWLIEPAHPAAQYERARRAASRLINADADDVALISSVSYGVAAAAKLVTVPARSRVLVLENDHSSAVLEWTTRAPSGQFSVEVVARPGDGDWTAAVLAAIERPGAPPVGLASISSVHWSDGGVVDMDRVGAALRRQGAMLLVDATHAAGVMPIDVRSLDPDFLVFPTYKWQLGPYARAFLDVAKRRQLRPPRHHLRAGELLSRYRIRRRRAALRYGRARSFHLAGDGVDRNGDDGAVGLRGRAGAVGRAHRAAGGSTAQRRRDYTRCRGAGAAYPERAVFGRHAGTIDRTAGVGARLRRAPRGPRAHQPARLQRRGRHRSFCRYLSRAGVLASLGVAEPGREATAGIDRRPRMTEQNPHWPALPLEAWEPTRATLHMWTQIVGKVRLALTPYTNHWWQVPLYVTARGLTTSPIPYEGETL